MYNQDATALSDQLHHFFHRSFLWCSDGEWCWIFRYFKCRYCCSSLGQHHMVIRFKRIFWWLGIVLCEAYMLWWFAAKSSGCIWLPPWKHATSKLHRCLTRRALWGWWHLWYANWHQQLLLGDDLRFISHMSRNVWLFCWLASTLFRVVHPVSRLVKHLYDSSPCCEWLPTQIVVVSWNS